MSSLSNALSSLSIPVDDNGYPLDPLTPLAPVRPNTTPAPASTSETGTQSESGSGSADYVAQLKAALSGTGIEQWLTASSVNIVAVVIGLVLVAGAVWGLDQVRETVVSTAKGAADLAAA